MFLLLYIISYQKGSTFHQWAKIIIDVKEFSPLSTVFIIKRSPLIIIRVIIMIRRVDLGSERVVLTQFDP